MSNDTTTIQVSIQNYKRLSALKNPGDSFDDVLGRVLDENERTDAPEESEDGTDTQPMSSADRPIDDASGESEEIPDNLIPPTDIEQSQQLAFDSDDRLGDDVEQAILELDLSTSASRTEWIPAIRRAYQYLSNRGQASKQEFIDDVYPDSPAGYDNEQSWWRKVIRPGLTELPRVEKPGPGGKWQFE